MVGKLIDIFIYSSINQTTTICPTDTILTYNNIFITNTTKPVHHWCTFQVVDQMTIKVQTVYFFIIVILFMFFMGLFFKLKKQRSDPPNRRFLGSQYVMIYKIISVWFVSTMIRVGICVAVYYIFMKKDFQNQQMPDLDDPQRGSMDYSIVILASIYNFFNFFCAFLIDFLIVFIPYIWMKNLIENLNQNERQPNLQKSKKINKISKVLQIVKVNFIACAVFSQPFIFFYTQFQMKCQMPLYNYGFTIVQTFLFLGFYIFGAYVLYYFLKIDLISIQPKHLLKIAIQYLLLLLALLTRIALNIYSFIMIQFTQNPKRIYRPNHHCSDMNPGNDVEFVTTLSLHHLLMHCLPILVVLYIYYPKVSKESDMIRSRIQFSDTIVTQQPIMSFTSTQRQQKKVEETLRSSASEIFDKLLEQQTPTYKRYQQNKKNEKKG